MNVESAAVETAQAPCPSWCADMHHADHTSKAVTIDTRPRDDVTIAVFLEQEPGERPAVVLELANRAFEGPGAAFRVEMYLEQLNELRQALNDFSKEDTLRHRR